MNKGKKVFPLFIVYPMKGRAAMHREQVNWIT